MVPWLGVRTFDIMLKSVVFPEPLGPTIARISFSLTLKLRLLTAFNEPKLLLRFVPSRIANCALGILETVRYLTRRVPFMNSKIIFRIR